MHDQSIRVARLLAAWAVLASSSMAQIGAPLWGESAKLLASDAEVGDEFAWSVALHGERAALGAKDDGDAPAEAGSVYVYLRSGTGWAEEQKLTASDGGSQDRFGYSVALFDDTLVVGARDDDEGGSFSGSAYVFVRSGSGWTEQQKLTASDAAGGDRFGQAVTIGEDTILVGAPGRSNPGVSAGAVYVFTRSGSTWSESQQLLASDSVRLRQFGAALDLELECAVIGAPHDQHAGPSSGAVYVFERVAGAFLETQKLVASDAAELDEFGASTSVSGPLLLVGARWRDDAGADSGAAYVFHSDGSTWSEEAKLVASDAAAGHYFGSSVALAGEVALVGAYGVDDACPTLPQCNSGAAYLFARSGTTWTEQTKVVAGDGAAFDSLGFAVALWGNRALTGAHGKGEGAGAAYLFERPSAMVSSRTAGPNPSSYTAAPPVLGASWSAQVDLSAGSHSHAQVLGCAAPGATTLPGGQVLLVAAPRLFTLPAAPGPLASWTVLLPADVSLAGSSAYTQAVHLFGAPSFVLSNAQDLVLGF